MADRPRIVHECTNSAIIRLFVIHSWTVFSANYNNHKVERNEFRSTIQIIPRKATVTEPYNEYAGLTRIYASYLTICHMLIRIP